MIAQTSQMAYDELVASGKEETQRGVVLSAVLLRPGGVTRRELSKLTGLEIGATTGRVNGLVRDGLLDDSEVVTCGVTGRPVKLIKPVEYIKPPPSEAEVKTAFDSLQLGWGWD